MNTNDLLPFFKELTDKTSNICKEYYRKPIKVKVKKDKSPVTILDKKVEEKIIDCISREFSGHNIYTEETGIINRTGSEFEWVIDPIDGTKTFIHGVPLFATLIALLKNGIPIVGMYHNPILEDLVVGDNQICIHNDNPTKMRSCNHFSDAVILTTDHFAIGQFQDQDRFDNLIKKCKMYRTWADAYGYFLLATGYADIMIDPIMSRWDALALIPIIKGAGGGITDYQGNSPIEAESIIAAPKNLLPDIVNLLNPNI
ncbi:inositol monophosphatase family protein [Aquimarina celericrescens]|uniref:Inositol monophosphatase family protein n=1 Tax=Aquimarina celericrescens TaxID=1964542 RepID=A0ABW5AZC7_9FLAO|nr:hypothetical protein [Aquimarina celericrescens]